LKCDSRITTLYRDMGRENANTIVFHISEEKRRKYFQDNKDASAKDLIVAAQALLHEYEREESEWAEGGQFLPPSAWDIKGFPGDKIARESDPADHQVHPILGDCYRVKIRSQFERGVRGTDQRKHFSIDREASASSNGFVKPIAKASPPVVEPKSSENSSSSDSSDSSSSSSDKKKKKKKSKKADKKKKAKKQKADKKKSLKKAKKEKEREALRKKDQKNVDNSIKYAADALSKISTVRVSLDAAISNQSFHFCPISVQEHARESAAELEKWERAAQKVIESNGDASYHLSFPPATLRTIVATGKRSENTLQQFYKFLVKTMVQPS
jgi:chemotaxis protein histidine kinase CheA